MLDRFICHQPEEGDVPGRKNFDTTQVIGTGWKLLGGGGAASAGVSQLGRTRMSVVAHFQMGMWYI